MTDTTFAALGLPEALLRPLAQAGYSTPTPIQAQAIPRVREGRDLIAIAQTGTGKTAAFALPLVEALGASLKRLEPRTVRALILAPTRELALQIAETIDRFGRPLKLTHATVFGGVGHGNQIKALARGVDVLVACPGRLLDLIAGRHVRLDQVTHLILDEADRMLDMGFFRDVKKIIAAVPAKGRQTLLFSATMPGEVAELAETILKQPVRVEVTPEVVTVEKIRQTIFAVPIAAKRGLLLHLLEDPALDRVVVFTRTKHGANRLAEQLEKSGVVADAIHGNKSQGARQRALDGFREGSVRVLVATDIAARGIDVDGVSHVVNYDMPVEPESYVHRIGRTARAGRDGTAYSFCDGSERDHLRAIEKLTRLRFQLVPSPVNASPPDPRHAEPRRDEPRRDDMRRDGRGHGAPRGRGPAETRGAAPHAAKPQPANAQKPQQGHAAKPASPQPHHEPRARAEDPRAAKPAQGRSRRPQRRRRTQAA